MGRTMSLNSGVLRDEYTIDNKGKDATAYEQFHLSAL